jgi:hypothetical protein
MASKILAGSIMGKKFQTIAMIRALVEKVQGMLVNRAAWCEFENMQNLACAQINFPCLPCALSATQKHKQLSTLC